MSFTGVCQARRLQKKGEKTLRREKVPLISGSEN